MVGLSYFYESIRENMKHRLIWRNIRGRVFFVATLCTVVLVVAGFWTLRSPVVAQTSDPVKHFLVNNDLQDVVYPMEIRVGSVSLIESSGRYSLIVELSANNNLGLEPNYASARVELESYNLTLSYQYTSTSGATETGVTTIKPSAFLVLTPDQHGVFSVNAAVLPSTPLGSVDVTVSGGYTWVLRASTNTADGTIIRIVNGQGLIPEYSQSLVVPR